MRYYYLDFARGLLMSLGVIIHSSLVFKMGSVWLLVSDNQHEVFNYVIRFLHSFRMESFYLISGFFSLMIIERYSTKTFIKSRLERLGIPLLFIGLTLNSVMFLRAENVAVDVFSFAYWVGGYWLAHLWFLSNLIVYSFILLLFVKIVGDRVFNIGNLRINYYFLILSVGIVVMLLRRIEWRLPDPIYGDSWVFFKQIKLMLYAPYYFVGAVFYLNKNLFNQLLDSILINSLISAIGFLIIVVVPDSVNPYLDEFIRAIYGLAYTGLLFGLFRRFFNKPSSVSYAISDASYTIYVLHQPLIVLLGYYILKLDIHFLFQFFIIVIIGWGIPYLFHIKVVRRYKLVGILINGKNYN